MQADPDALAAWQQPTLAIVGPLDMALALLLLVALMFGAVSSLGPLVFRARLSEALAQASARRNEVVERFALSGMPVELPGEITAVSLPRTAADHMAGKGGGGPAAAPPPSFFNGAARQRQSEGYDTPAVVSKQVSTLHIDGAVIVVAGQIDGLQGRPYELALYPVVQDGRVPQVLVWQCGRHALGPGWVGPSPDLQQRLPDALLPSACRAQRPPV